MSIYGFEVKIDSSVERIVEEVINLVKENLSTGFRLYLFGSYATGKNTPYSDIDIALETFQPVSYKTIAKIKQLIEDIRTLKKIDFVYLNEAPNLVEIVKREGILIYESSGQN